MRDPTAWIAGAGTLLFAAAVACAFPAGKKATPREQEKKTSRVAAGTWGGVGIALEVTENGGSLDFDCAHGTIGQPLLLDAKGSFDVKGAHAAEHGGPVREGEDSRGRPVRYKGVVSGDSMTLTIQPEGADAPTGSYDLTRGRNGRIRKCL